MYVDLYFNPTPPRSLPLIGYNGSGYGSRWDPTGGWGGGNAWGEARSREVDDGPCTCGQRYRAGSAISNSRQKNDSGSTGDDSGDSVFLMLKESVQKKLADFFFDFEQIAT